jgi:hypothetical protein
MKYIFIHSLYLSLFLILLLSAHTALSATISLVPEKRALSVGEDFKVDVQINTAEDFINAAQGSVSFPTDILEVVSTDNQGSVFSFWVQEPDFDNTSGAIAFIGGTAKGASGASLKVFSINFKTKGAGSADIVLSDAVVTASDGKGTNILSTIKSANVVVGTSVVAPKPIELPVVTEEDSIPIPKNTEAPKKVERIAVVASELPQTPSIRIPLYPEEDKWYSHIGDVIVLWDLPDDVVQVSTRLSHSKDEKPGEKDEELFTGKNLGSLSEEGIWFVRVQFKNNIGWSGLAYREIKLDTTAPLPFEVRIDQEVSDNPSPEIHFDTSDSLSGIKEFVIYVDGSLVLRSSSSSVLVPPQRPGVHTLAVHAVDNAGNRTEDDVQFEVLPLPTPRIDFVTASAPLGEPIFIAGTTIPNAFVDIVVRDKNGAEVFTSVANSDQSGNWKFVIHKDQLHKRGVYSISASARDLRGAVSFAADPYKFKVRAPIILSTLLGDFGWFEILLFFSVIAFAFTSLFAWHMLGVQKKRYAYTVIAGRDVDKLTTILLKDVEDLKNRLNATELGLSNRTELDALISRLDITLGKMKKYVGMELNKITKINI